MAETIRQTLPAIYQPLLPDFFDGSAIVEERAPCHDCAMCDKGKGQASPDVVFFRPDAKCCTFHPHLPNYLVGALLVDPDPALAEGRRRILAKIDQRIGVTPRWLAPPKKFSVLLPAARASSFGRSLVLRCPYFEPDGGLCTIWRHRESSCSTFFCKHVGGGDGKQFWTALELYLRHVEQRLARHAVESLAPHLTEPQTARDKLTLEDLEDRAPNAADYQAFWREWEGREAAFYQACHAHVAGLSRAEFDRVTLVESGSGPEPLGELQRRYATLRSPKLAERLSLNADMTVQPAEGGVVVYTYSRYESLHLNEQLYEVLKEFTGKESVAEVRARLYRDYQVEVPEEMLLSMQQFRVLLPAGS